MMSTKVKLSASRIKTLELCSYKYYLEKIVKLPDVTHPKTIVGTVCHEFLEWLNSKENRIENWKILKEKSYNIEKFKEAKDYLDNLISKYSVQSDLIPGIIPMLNVAIYYFDNAFKNADEVFNPEFDFELNGNSYELIGFIDLIIRYGNRYLICDMKSQGQKFEKSEINFNIQALMYQLAIKKIFNAESDVEFILMRFPPRPPRYPNNHIQRVEYIGDDAIIGLESYLEHLGIYLENFDEKKAKLNFAIRNPTKQWFCNKNKGDISAKGEPAFYCPLKYPFDYFEKSKDGKIIKSAFSYDELLPLNEGEIIEEKQYSGCPAFINL